MKRSSSSTDCKHTSKKFCARHHCSDQHSDSAINNTNNSSCSSSCSAVDDDKTIAQKSSEPDMSTTVLTYIQDVVHSLDKGRIDQCLSNKLSPDTLDQLDSKHAEIATALDAALKNIAQRQLQLETENLRYRIAIQQQHQLLTCQQNDREEYDQHHEDTNNDEDTVPLPTSSTVLVTNQDSTQQQADSHMTPEDGIPTVQDASLIERMQTAAHPIVSLSSTHRIGKLLVSLVISSSLISHYSISQ